MTWMRHQFNPRKHILFNPTNVDKYIGSLPCVMRSKLELKFANWLDQTPAVLHWSSENIAIPYLHPIKRDKAGNRKMAKYFPDFIIEINTVNGPKTLIVEIKPEKETTRPKPKNNKKVFINEQMTYMVNVCKWQACAAYCDKKGYLFKIVTDKDIDKIK